MTPPNNITLSKDKKLLTVSFKDDDYALTSEFLRVYSPSAEVSGHGPGQETLQLNKQDVSNIFSCANGQLCNCYTF